MRRSRRNRGPTKTPQELATYNAVNAANNQRLADAAAQKQRDEDANRQRLLALHANDPDWAYKTLTPELKLEADANRARAVAAQAERERTGIGWVSEEQHQRNEDAKVNQEFADLGASLAQGDPSNALVDATRGGFLVTPGSRNDKSYGSVDELIQGRTGEALNILNMGERQQSLLSGAATQGKLDSLRQMDDMRAFNEQQSLLGLNGVQAQQQAIGGIPISDFETEMQSRQQKQLQRNAAARGELGGGATFEAGAQLAGAQQANVIQNRLSQLEPLVALSRGVRSDMSNVIESGAVDRANIQSGLGTAQGNIRLGAAAPTIQSIQNRAELSGLQGIAKANSQASMNNQLAGLAGSIGQSFF